MLVFLCLYSQVRLVWDFSFSYFGSHTWLCYQGYIDLLGYVENIHSSSIFWKHLNKIETMLSLKTWRTGLCDHLGSSIFLVGRFFTTAAIYLALGFFRLFYFILNQFVGYIFWLRLFCTHLKVNEVPYRVLLSF